MSLSRNTIQEEEEHEPEGTEALAPLVEKAAAIFSAAEAEAAAAGDASETAGLSHEQQEEVRALVKALAVGLRRAGAGSGSVAESEIAGIANVVVAAASWCPHALGTYSEGIVGCQDGICRRRGWGLNP